MTATPFHTSRYIRDTTLVAEVVGLFLSIPVAILIVNWLIERHEKETWRFARNVALRRLQALLIWSVSRMLSATPNMEEEVRNQLWTTKILSFDQLSQALRSLLRVYVAQGESQLKNEQQCSNAHLVAWLIMTVPELRLCELDIGSISDSLARSSSSATLVGALEEWGTHLMLLRRLSWYGTSHEKLTQDFRNSLAASIKEVVAYSCVVSDATQCD